MFIHTTYSFHNFSYNIHTQKRIKSTKQYNTYKVIYLVELKACTALVRVQLYFDCVVRSRQPLILNE